MYEISYCSASLPAFYVVRVPYFGHSNECVVASHIVLICVSMMTYDVGGHMMWDTLCGVSLTCLFAICISPLVSCLLRSLAHF